MWRGVELSLARAVTFSTENESEVKLSALHGRHAAGSKVRCHPVMFCLEPITFHIPKPSPLPSPPPPSPSFTLAV